MGYAGGRLLSQPVSQSAQRSSPCIRHAHVGARGVSLFWGTVWGTGTPRDTLTDCSCPRHSHAGTLSHRASVMACVCVARDCCCVIAPSHVSTSHMDHVAPKPAGPCSCSCCVCTCLNT